MNINFGEKTFCTTVYIKFVAPDKLLLSKAVCHRLGVVTYHPEVQAVQRSPPKVIPGGTICDKRDTIPPASGNEEVTELRISPKPKASEKLEQQIVPENPV